MDHLFGRALDLNNPLPCLDQATHFYNQHTLKWQCIGKTSVLLNIQKHWTMQKILEFLSGVELHV